MTCTPQAILLDAACFDCFSIAQLQWLRTYLYCQYVNIGPTPPSMVGILGEGGEYILDEGGEHILPEN